VSAKPALKTFIRAFEVWVPDADHTLLEHGGGLYHGAPRFGAMSRSMCFGRGEGLPGRAWESGRPIVLKSFAGSYFMRTRAAAAEGLTCGIALPIFAGNELTAVIVIFCGDDADHAGAIELWHNAPHTSQNMTLDDGYYGTTAEPFESTSRQIMFRKGTGLPGLAWESGLPLFMPDLSQQTRFLRADSAAQVGVNHGLAIPCSTRGDDVWVMAFLSTPATPIARRYETWLPDAAQRQLSRRDGFCEQFGPIDGASGVRIDSGAGALGRTLARWSPSITEHAQREPGAVGAAAREAGLGSVVALPVVRDARIVAVVAWYF